MLRAAISTVAILVLVAACGSAPQGPASSCAATTASSTGVTGTRIADHTNGYAITLPAGWAQVDLGTGEIRATTPTATIAPDTAAFVERVASTLKGAGYEGLAVDVAAHSNESMSSMLGIDLSPAKGATLDSIASQEMTAARSGAEGEPQQDRLTMAGLQTVRTRFNGTEPDLHSNNVKVVLTNYVTIVGEQAFGLYFLVDPGNETTDAPVLEAMAQSLEIPDRAECPGAS